MCKIDFGLLALSLVLLWVGGCGPSGVSGGNNNTNNPPRSNQPQPGGKPVAEVSQEMLKLVEANNDFGFRLFAQLVEGEAEKNLFISPASVAMALTMTYNGAAGETQAAMAKAMALESTDLKTINRASAELRQILQNPDLKVELTIANSLWARAGVQFKPDFLERNRQFFGAEIAALDFNHPRASDTINRWVDRATKSKIKQIVDKIRPDTVMFLINAIYFKGRWKAEFDKAKTKDAPFHLADGTQKTVPMMSQSGKYPYSRGEGFQAISLPYGEGRVSLYLFLPDEGKGLSDFLKNLNRQNWEQWMSGFRPREVDLLQLPRFKVEYEEELSDALKALGMEIAFDPDRADFEGMRAERDLYLQRVKHKAVVEVNEEGTEAAAVTSVEVGVTSYQPPLRFIVNRPFFFAIRDNQTGAVLFMGITYEP